MSKRKVLDVSALDVVAGAPEQTVKRLEAKASGKAPSRVDKVQVSAFVTEDVRKRLKLMATEQSRSLNELLAEGIQILFEKY
jgi:hypothetical protein